MTNIKGKISQVIGPVIDVEFGAGKLPDIHNALIIKEKNVVCEVAQQIGDNTVRCIAMSSTEDIARGMEVEDTGSPIMVPVGDETLGRVFNVLGEAIDHGKPLKGDIKYPIHRKSPTFLRSSLLR